MNPSEDRQRLPNPLSHEGAPPLTSRAGEARPESLCDSRPASWATSVKGEGQPSADGGQWFVEEFHLRSPVEEFEEFSRQEMERLRRANAKYNETTYREAVDLVLDTLRPERKGSAR